MEWYKQLLRAGARFDNLNQAAVKQEPIENGSDQAEPIYNPVLVNLIPSMIEKVVLPKLAGKLICHLFFELYTIIIETCD